LRCESCNSIVDAPAKFCPNCGAAMRTESATLRRERKLVTVLFADVQSFTSLAERLDAEAVGELMQGFLRAQAASVERHGGYVDKFTGDGLMALFGAPKAHGDDADRAVMAALEMQKAAPSFNSKAHGRPTGSPLQLRVGINTGEVLVGAIAEKGTDYTAMGDTVNIAARLQTAAEVGTVLIGESMAKALRRGFRLGEPQALRLKGKEREIAGRVVLGVAAEDDEHSFFTRFVGREAELRRLCAALEECSGSKRLGLLLIEGEAGIGKSRLLAEFEDTLRTNHAPVEVLESSFSAFGAEMFSLPRRVVLRHYGLSDGAITGPGRSRLAETMLGDIRSHAATLDEPFKSDPELLTHFVAHAIGADPPDTRAKFLQPREARENALTGIRTLLEAWAEERPLVLAVEDLQWADEGTIEFLKALAEKPPCSAVMVVGTARDSLKGLAGGLEWERMRLSPLGREDSVKMASGVLGDAALDRGLEVGKSAGNPLFIEELSKRLSEGGLVVMENSGGEGGNTLRLAPGTEAPSLPAGIQSVINARLDALGESEREIVHLGSVAGNSFQEALIAHLAGRDVWAQLANLCEKGFMHRHAASGPWPSDAEVKGVEYVFRHGLIREVAYSRLLMKVRTELHGRVARWLEARMDVSECASGAYAQFCGVLAHHLEMAGENARAIDFYEKAGDAAFTAYSNEEALKNFTRAAELCESVAKEVSPDREPMKYFEWKVRRPFELLDKNSKVLEQLARFDEMVSAARKAYELAHQGMEFWKTHSKLNEIGRLSSEYFVEAIYMLTIELSPIPSTKKQELLKEGLAIAVEASDLQGQVKMLHTIGAERRKAGDAREAMRLYEKALSIAREHGLKGEGLISADMADLYLEAGRLDDAERAYRRFLEIAQQADVKMYEIQALRHIAEVLFARGRREDAVAMLETILPAARAIGDKFHIIRAEQRIAELRGTGRK
jgi:class 3 adenylate cyclase/tetratricopeptide (TPR) repeat protein